MCIIYELTHTEKKTPQAKFQETNQFESEYNETAELLYKGHLPSNIWLFFIAIYLRIKTCMYIKANIETALQQTVNHVQEFSLKKATPQGATRV